MSEENPAPTQPIAESPKPEEPKPESPKPEPKPPTPPANPTTNPDQVAMLLEKLNQMESKIEENKPKPKQKRKATAKQLENLAKAREKRNENMAKRKEIKKNIKIEEKKIVNKQLEKENITIEQKDVLEDVHPPSPPAKQPSPAHAPIVENAHANHPNIPASAPIPIPKGQTNSFGFVNPKPAYSFASRPNRRR